MCWKTTSAAVKHRKETQMEKENSKYIFLFCVKDKINTVKVSSSF